MLVDLAIKYLKEQKRLHISQNFQICQNLKFKGDPKNLKDFFNSKQKSEQKGDELNRAMENLSKLTPDSLLSQLKVSDDQSEYKNSGPDLIPHSNGNGKQPKAGLIEEIASVEAELKCPEYDLILKEADTKRLRRIVVRISLPDVTSVQDCELNIAEVILFFPLQNVC